MNKLDKKNSHIFKSLIVGSLIFSLFVTAIPIFAKENEKNDNKKEDRKENRDREDREDREDKEKVKENKGWAFGHFIAPGWIKKNGEVVVLKDVRMPYGIFKKLFGGNSTSTKATSTPDILAPVVSGLKITPQNNRAVVKFITNEKAFAEVFLSSTTPVNIASTSAVSSSNVRMINHEIVLKNLTSSTTYYIVIRTRDMAGNISLSSETSFVTSSGSVAVDTTAPKLSNVYAVVGTSTVSVNWLTNEPATSKIFYGTTLPLDTQSSTTARVENVSLVTSHSLTLSNLATSTKYYFVIESKDLAGNKKQSVDYYIMTPAGI